MENMFLYLYLHLYGTLEQYVQEMGVITFVWSFKGDVQVHSLVQEKMEGISIEVLFYTFCWSSFHKHLLIPMQVNEDDLTDVQAVIDGPPGTPYQGDLSTYSSIKYISNKIPPAKVMT